MTDQKLNLSENPDNESYEGTWYHDQETLQQRKNSKQKEDSTRIYKNLQGTKDKHHKITYMINYQLLIENQLQIMLKVKRS